MIVIKEYEQKPNGDITSVSVQLNDGTVQKFVKEPKEQKKEEVPEVVITAEEPKKKSSKK